MTSQADIRAAAEALAAAAAAPATVLLFGSRARGNESDDSDIDFLVVEAEVEDRLAETVRLSAVLGRLRIPGDVVVVSEEQVDEWGHVEGTMLHDALREGRTLVKA